MNFFVDTASIAEIREAASLGMLDGVTVNASLIAKEGKPFKQPIIEICEIAGGPASTEVIATEAGAMFQEAREYAGRHEHVVVTLPTPREGLKAAKCLSEQGIKTNVTLCFCADQAILVAKTSATCVSPFVRFPADFRVTGTAVSSSFESLSSWPF